MGDKSAQEKSEVLSLSMLSAFPDAGHAMLHDTHDGQTRRTPSPRGRTGSTTPTTGGSVAATSTSLDPGLLLFLDLVGRFIAERIVAEASGVPSPESPTATPQGSPGIPGPIPIVPADSRPASRSTPTQSRNRRRKPAPPREESRHASN